MEKKKKISAFLDVCVGRLSFFHFKKLETNKLLLFFLQFPPKTLCMLLLLQLLCFEKKKKCATFSHHEKNIFIFK